TIENAINLFKKNLPDSLFYRCGSQLGPAVVMTDNSYAERNALSFCWPNSVRLLCVFHVLQALWRWLYDSKYKIYKDDCVLIMQLFKKVLYVPTISEMEILFFDLKESYFTKYTQLAIHLSHLWKRRTSWALAYHQNLLI
ncbi:9318_t:CDS:1, partial [Gigaspora margarita]